MEPEVGRQTRWELREMGQVRTETLTDVSESEEATIPLTQTDRFLPFYGDCLAGPRASDSTAFPFLVSMLQSLLTERGRTGVGSPMLRNHRPVEAPSTLEPVEECRVC